MSLFDTTETERLRVSEDIMDRAIRSYRPGCVLGMLSGGNDSQTACHVASRRKEFSGVVHINTGTGIAETREHVDRICSLHGWKLKEYHPPMPPFSSLMNPLPKTAYEAIVRWYGFPGPGGHRVVYNRLKERCVRAIVQDHKQHARDNVLLVSGVRLEESTRRMGTGEEMGKEGCRVWCAPILHWDGYQKSEYMRKHGLIPNPVTTQLCISGECTCGAFARQGELDDYRKFYPAKADDIDRLEKLVAADLSSLWAVYAVRSVKIEGRKKSERVSLGDFEAIDADGAVTLAIAASGPDLGSEWKYMARRYNCRWGVRPPPEVYCELDDPTDGDDASDMMLCQSCESKGMGAK